MFTVKQQYESGNHYHSWSAVSYYVDKEPRASVEGNSDGRADSRHEIAVLTTVQPEGTIYPRITLELANGSERIIDVCGDVFIENSAGKTIDRVSPYVA